MRIHHYISCCREELELDLQSSGIIFEDDQYGIVDIYEDDKKWTTIQKIIAQSKPYDDGLLGYLDTITTYFTHTELLNTEYCFINSTLAHYFPLPDSDFLTQTYDGNGCFSCGIGFKQKDLFRIKKEPVWAKNTHFFKLNLIEDELFVKKKTWEKYLKPLGIKANPVIKGMKGRIILETVVQLVIDKVSDYPLNLKTYEHLFDLDYEICVNCGQKKYILMRKGNFPSLLGSTDALFFKTQEYFGGGGAAMKEIIISQYLYKILYDNKLIGKIHFRALNK